MLVTQPAFIPQDAGASADQQLELIAELRAAAHAGFPIRVAIIPSAYDLGSVTAL